MGNALTKAEICDLNLWHEVVSSDLHYINTGTGTGQILVPNQDALVTSPVLQRHLRYHEQLERAKWA